MTPPAVQSEIGIRAERVVQLGDEMSHLLEEEMAFLASRNRLGYGDFVKKKQQLLMDYQSAVKSLLSNKEQLDKLSGPQRAALRATGSKLDVVAGRNAEKLSVTAAATHKVLQVIIDTVRREADSKRAQFYNPSQFTSYRDDRMPTRPPVLLTEKA